MKEYAVRVLTGAAGILLANGFMYFSTTSNITPFMTVEAAIAMSVPVGFAIFLAWELYANLSGRAQVGEVETKVEVETKIVEAPPRPREWIDKTPQEMMFSLRDLRSIDIDNVAVKYSGKWAIVEGSVSDVSNRRLGVVVNVGVNDELLDIDCAFTIGDMLRPISFQKGDSVGIAGVVDEVRGYSISLTACEVLRHTPADVQVASLRDAP